jgi:broad specificity phosphatase PhoE
MSTLLLVRHAQASFFEKNYDQLSPVGEEQGRKLGEYLVKRGQKFDRAYTGPARRHRQTLDQVAAVYREAGLEFPEPVELVELQEHRADQLLRETVDELAEEDDEIRQLAKNYRESVERADLQKNFQKLFERITLLWTQDALNTDAIEPWSHFQGRVRQGMKKITSEAGKSSRAIAFSSVGPITIALQAALGTTNEEALHMGWRLRNCAMTEFIFGSRRVTVDLFNSVAHLEEHGLVTYR